MEWQAQVGFSVRISLKSIVRNSPLEVWVRRRADHVGTWVGLIQAQRGQSALPRRCKLWGAPLPCTHFLKLARGRSDGHLACLPAHAQGGVRGVVLLTHLKPFTFKLKAAFLKKAEAWWDIRTSRPASCEWTITCHQIVDENQQKEPDELMESLIQGYKENNSRDR